MRELEPGLTTDLTARQEEVLDFIEDFITRERMPPTRDEIANHFGIRRNAADQTVRRLAQLRRIELVPLVSRGIKLSDEWRLG